MSIVSIHASSFVINWVKITEKRFKKNDLNYFLYSAQMLMKFRLAGAHKGHGLLKKKADALQMRFRLILGKIIEVICSRNSKIYP